MNVATGTAVVYATGHRPEVILDTRPKDVEVMAFEAGCEEYCEREVDEVEWQGDRLYLHLGVWRDDSQQR